MLKKVKQSIVVIYRAGYNLVYNDGIELAGYLTFLAILAVFPFLVLMLSAFGFVGQGELGTQFIAQVIRHLPKDSVAALMPRISEITSLPPQGLLTVAILGALWTSSSAVEGIRTVLNRAYRVSAPPHFFFRRLMSMAQIIVVTILVMLVMGILVLAPIAVQSFSQMSGLQVPPGFVGVFVDNFVYISASILFLVVASLYYILPNIKQSMLAVIPGAALVVALWVMGASAVTFFLDNISSVNLIYGSLSSFIATLIFFYVMNVIFIYGAEFNHALLEALGKHMYARE
jgi:membrane protein